MYLLIQYIFFKLNYIIPILYGYGYFTLYIIYLYYILYIYICTLYYINFKYFWDKYG